MATFKEIIYKHVASRKIFVTLITMAMICGTGITAGLDKHLTEVYFALLTAGGFHAAGHALADFAVTKGAPKDPPDEETTEEKKK